MSVSAPADVHQDAPTVGLARVEDDRQLAMAASCAWDEPAWRMLEHWHGVPYPGPEATEAAHSRAKRLQIGSIWTLLAPPLASRDPELFLVIVDERIAGLRWIEDTSVDGVATTGGWLAPEHRGRGIGRTVLRTLTRYALQRGAGWVSTSTRDDNVAARANLIACGYVRTPHLEDPAKDREACGTLLRTFTYPSAGNDPHGCPAWR